MTLLAHLATHDVHRRVWVAAGSLGGTSYYAVAMAHADTLFWIFAGTVVAGIGGGIGGWIASGIKSWFQRRRWYRRWLAEASSSSPPPPRPPGAP